MAVWERVATGLAHGGYVAWESGIAEASGDTARDHVPVFAALCAPPSGAMTLAQAIDATLALPGLHLSRHERDLLATERALAGEGWPHEVRIAAYCPRAMLDQLPEFWRVVQVGPPLALPPAAVADPGQNLCALAGDLDPAVPLAAVIDDGIAYLNTRFRRNRAESRIKAVWLQGPEQLAGDVTCGRVLQEDEINTLIAEGADEAATYARINRAVLPVADGATTNRRAAHGTHVLDLAAGTAPWSGEALGAVPILAVQLPPASVRETAGRRLEGHLVQGLRWIMAEALRLANGTDVPPVVVNISLGSLAGPGDSHAFLADWFAHEVARHARLTAGGKLRLVIAYGNARLARLVAREEMRLSHPLELIWRILPDDRSSSHLELRVDSTQTSGLTLDLQPPPASGLPGLTVGWPEAGSGWRLAGPLALVSAQAEAGGQTVLQLALGPTVSDAGLPPAPAGAWRVVVRTTMAEPVRIIARVQRDDTPPSYRGFGRQSWLDHPQAWDWDAELRGYLAPRLATDAPGCPVTREGTSVAYAGADGPAIIFVGAARPVIGQPGAVQPAAYSSEGVGALARPGESRGPVLVALGDDGAMLPGRRASGVGSGSSARMSGTSMAAPQVTRALLRYFQTVPPADQTPEAERAVLTGTADWDTPDRRMGQGMLVG